LVNRGTMGVNSLPKTVTRQRRDCDLNPGPSAPESSTLTTRYTEPPQSMYNNDNNKGSLSAEITRDHISVPAPLDACTALQLCSHYGFLLFLYSRQLYMLFSF